MASFDMILSLHCDLAPRIILACPLGFQLLLTWVCYLPASTATSSMLWHFVEHIQCVHWTRPERAYCSHAAAPTRWPPRLWPALQNLATRSPPRSIAPNHPGTLQRRCQGVLGGTPASAVAPATGSAAQTPPSRHLAPGAARAHPQPCPLALVAATMPCCYRTSVRRKLIHGRRGTALTRL